MTDDILNISEEIYDYGPRMRALPDRWRKFVLILLQQVRPNYLLAAKNAGYPTKDDGGSSDPKMRRRVLKQIGWRLAQNEKVIAALNEEVARSFRSTGGLVGYRVMMRIAMDDKHKDQLRAAEALANRSGHGVEQQINVSHHHTDNTGKALEARARAAAERLGMDADEVVRRLFGGEGVAAVPKLIDVTPDKSDV